MPAIKSAPSIAQFVTDVKNLMLEIAARATAIAGFARIQSDTFKDATGINAGTSSGYTHRGSPNFDVIRTTAVPSDRKLLLRFNGSDGSTTFTDSENTPKTVTAVGNAQLDTADKKFGSASLLLDGTGDCASLADSSDWEFGSGDFQVDFWMKLNAVGIQQTMFSLRETGGQNDMKIYVDTNNKLCAFAQRAGANVFTTMVGTTTLTTGAWYHVALYRIGNNFYLTLNGVQEATVNSSSQMGTGTFTLRIGAYNTDSAENFNGWIDDVRVIKAAVSFSAPPFTAPTTEADDTTQADIRQTTLTIPSATTQVILFADVTLNTGGATYYVSSDNGSTWKTVTTAQMGQIISVPSGTQLVARVVLTGDAELEHLSIASAA